MEEKSNFQEKKNGKIIWRKKPTNQSLIKFERDKKCNGNEWILKFELEELCKNIEIESHEKSYYLF